MQALYRYVLSFFLLIMMSLSAEEMQQTHVSAESAYYNGKEVQLWGHVVVSNALGCVQAEKATLVRDEERVSSFDFPWVLLKRGVKVELRNGTRLECGSMALDLAAWTSSFEAEEGKEWIYYVDLRGEIFAHRALVDYVSLEGKVEPKKITLIGNVILKRSCEEHQQYAQADLVEIFPQEEKMVLKSLGEEPVFFFDTAKQVQISAYSICAHRENGREVVQGEGNVQCLFSQQELETHLGKIQGAFRKR